MKSLGARPAQIEAGDVGEDYDAGREHQNSRRIAPRWARRQQRRRFQA